MKVSIVSRITQSDNIWFWIFCFKTVKIFEIIFQKGLLQIWTWLIFYLSVELRLVTSKRMWGIRLVKVRWHWWRASGHNPKSYGVISCTANLLDNSNQTAGLSLLLVLCALLRSCTPKWSCVINTPFGLLPYIFFIVFILYNRANKCLHFSVNKGNSYRKKSF